ncbi:MAG: tRNA (adenosine(37)-N6)-dimethylallyltransferase MiaA [Nocardioidaceae bacterium]
MSTAERVCAIVGPTAAGKSDLALAVALRGGAEIVNADSMQLYRGMDIGTAKLAPGERRGVRHHLIDVLEVSEPATVAEFQGWARTAITDCHSRNVVPVLVGGSALYVRAVLDDFAFPGTDAAVRARLETELAAHGAPTMHERLAELDPDAAAKILPGNGRRIVRALEVIELTGSRYAASLPAPAYGYDDVRVVGLDVPRRRTRRADRAARGPDVGGRARRGGPSARAAGTGRRPHRQARPGVRAGAGPPGRAEHRARGPGGHRAAHAQVCPPPGPVVPPGPTDRLVGVRRPEPGGSRLQAVRVRGTRGTMIHVVPSIGDLDERPSPSNPHHERGRPRDVGAGPCRHRDRDLAGGHRLDDEGASGRRSPPRRLPARKRSPEDVAERSRRSTPTQAGSALRCCVPAAMRPTRPSRRRRRSA